MRVFRAVLLGAVLLLFRPGYVFGQVKATEIFLLEDVANKPWCSYTREAPRQAAVEDAEAMTVASLIYSNGRLSQINVTETGETGDWIVYDNYFLDSHRQIVKLTRWINVLPGDRSVLQTFSISGGRARQTATTEKWLSTGQPLRSPEPVWLPELPVRTDVKSFPFSALLGRPGLRTRRKLCVQAPALQE